MSAAATAAGYLYASGRLRGKNSHDHDDKAKPQRKMRVAVVAPDEPQLEDKPQVQKTRPAPKIQYRTRRAWKPE